MSERYLKIETTNTHGNDFIRNLAKVVITVTEPDLAAAVLRVTQAFEDWNPSEPDNPSV